MSIIGIGTVTIVSLILFVRSQKSINKGGVALMWGVSTVILAGLL